MNMEMWYSGNLPRDSYDEKDESFSRSLAIVWAGIRKRLFSVSQELFQSGDFELAGATALTDSVQGNCQPQ